MGVYFSRGKQTATCTQHGCAWSLEAGPPPSWSCLEVPAEECSYSDTLDQRGVLCLLSLTQCAALGVVREEGYTSQAAESTPASGDRCSLTAKICSYRTHLAVFTLFVPRQVKFFLPDTRETYLPAGGVPFGQARMDAITVTCRMEHGENKVRKK